MAGELAPLTEDVLVPKAVAEALEVSERLGEPFTDKLADVWGKQLRRLWKLQHLVEATAGLVEKLLDSRPRRGSWPPAGGAWSGRRGKVACASLSGPSTA